MQRSLEPSAEDLTDLVARRPEILRRLLDLGIPAETLELIFPEWEAFLDAARQRASPA